MKLFVGNLPFTASEADIRELFDEFGAVVDMHIPLDRDTGRPRGFAFVTMDSPQAMESAINEINGTDVGGRTLKVNEAKPRN